LLVTIIIINGRLAKGRPITNPAQTHKYT